VFFRLVEPRMSVVTEVQQGTQTVYLDRVPVDQPLSVDALRDGVAGVSGVGDARTFTAAETVPTAASLGLGYVLRMSQQWKFNRLGLGDLVYSLPLAPGEQQQVAVFERRDTSSVQESEFFTESEAVTQAATSDTSTQATFKSAFREAAQGGSAFSTQSKSDSSGSNFILVSSGNGSSSSQGATNSWLQGQRDATEEATQATHSAAQSQASARVEAHRTGMRLATGSESMGVTTKTITNHNHAHALTIQYWEVLRLYDVTTVIDGLTLVCLVPMELVRFMPPGLPVQLPSPGAQGALTTRDDVLARYSGLLRHIDVLQAAAPRAFQKGLGLLASLAADPTTPILGAAEDVITFMLKGGFLPCEEIRIFAVTKRNTRVGPVLLEPSTPHYIDKDKYTTRDGLVAGLRDLRSQSTTLMGRLALPASLDRSDVVGFEIVRQFKTFGYTLLPPVIDGLARMSAVASAVVGALEQSANVVAQLAGGRQTVTLSPGDLESLIGGPSLDAFSAATQDPKGDSQETYANDTLVGVVLPTQPFPVPALQVAPVLRYRDLLEIEKSAQHVVRNTTTYSKAVWMSLTDEERAILLDGYTIGAPPDGAQDDSQMIPLLNCVQNKVLGTFGNSLIMPFTIPAIPGMDTDAPAKIQQALLAYQRQNFVPPVSTIALPTRGVLAEAVLGHCPSAEKIDLRRFWNWQDAPADTAPGIGMVQVPTTTPPLTTGVTAPNSLTNLPPLINNLITAPQPNTALLSAMGQAAAGQQDFTGLTGQQQLQALMQSGQTLASTARAEALQASQKLTSQAMATIGNLVGTQLGNSTAGSSAASSANGNPQPPLGTTKNQATAGTSSPADPGKGKQPAAGKGNAQDAGKDKPTTPTSTTSNQPPTEDPMIDTLDQPPTEDPMIDTLLGPDAGAVAAVG
jgi:hypothetical protein